jgi:hypothetical protein
MAATARRPHASREAYLAERASDRCDLLEDALKPQSSIRDQIVELLEEIDAAWATVAGRISEAGYDPGNDRIDTAEQATLLMSGALSSLRAAREEMRRL